MNLFRKLIISLLITSYFWSGSCAIAQEVIDLSKFEEGTLGNYLTYFQESKNQKLTLDQAIKHFNGKNVIQGNSNSISLGIGTEPVWLKISVNNPLLNAKAYRLTVETPWLDFIDTWKIQNNNIQKKYSGGDAVSFEKRPMPYRFYAFEADYLSGLTDLYIRIESLGPMAIPIRMSILPKAISSDISAGYQYGFLYGLMAALALYNLILFLMIRQREYGLYSIYLFGFIANSLSYTGQLHTVITQDFGLYFQDWLDAFLMITYSVAGLHFARFLLNTASYAPKLNKAIYWITIAIPIGMLIGALFNYLVFSLILAFILNSSFALLFIAMGFFAYKARVPSALLFLFSSVTAATCIGISTMAVAGLLPYNSFTFKAIEVGMAFEAITLALILAQRFRLAQRDKLIAENFARIDPLTNLYNRRGFLDIIEKFWQSYIRNERDFSIVFIDIDHFKNINDTFGHALGDLVLSKIALCINNTARTGDIISRWGGEEFILLLPETNQEEAVVQAERLRVAIAALAIPCKNEILSVTGSFGVVGTNQIAQSQYCSEDFSIDYFIIKADQAMYKAKSQGKNQICSYN